MKYSLTFILLFVISTNQSKSQSLNIDSKMPFEKDVFTQNIQDDATLFLNSSKNILISPYHFQKDDWLLTGLIVGLTAFSFTMDKTIRTETQKLHSAGMNKITNIGEHWGNPKYGNLLGGVLYAGGHLLGDKKIRKTGLMLAETLLLNSIIIKILKTTIGRSRPTQEQGNLDILGFQTNNTGHSLPSGHTSTAFAVSTVLSKQIDNIYASIALYSLAGLTAFQRTYSQNHWFSDTVLGAAIGILIGLKVVSFHSENEEPQNDGLHLSVEPVYNEIGTGLGFSLHF